MYDLALLVASCALLGCVVGFLAGLLGIGGGLIIVPVLSSLLLMFDVTSPDHVLVISIATSLASILFTSTSSVLAHHKNDNLKAENLYQNFEMTYQPFDNQLVSLYLD